jgi:hypothetical protein
LKRPSKSNLEEEHAIKEEAERFLRGLQHGEYFTDQDIIKHSLKIQRILARYFAACDINNDSSINNYSIGDSDFYQCDNNNDDDYDPILDYDDEEPSEGSVWACTICPEDCWKCPGYLVNHFTEEKINCFCQCHLNNEKMSCTKHSSSTATPYSLEQCSGGADVNEKNSEKMQHKYFSKTRDLSTNNCSKRRAKFRKEDLQCAFVDIDEQLKQLNNSYDDISKVRRFITIQEIRNRLYEVCSVYLYRLDTRKFASHEPGSQTPLNSEC